MSSDPAVEKSYMEIDKGGHGGDGGGHGGGHSDKKVHAAFMTSFLKLEDGVHKLPWFPEETYILYDAHHNIEIEYQLTMNQRVFVMMEDNASSILGALVAFTVTTCIILGCICFILAEEPHFWDWDPVKYAYKGCKLYKDIKCSPSDDKLAFTPKHFDGKGDYYHSKDLGGDSYSYLPCPYKKYKGSRRLDGETSAVEDATYNTEEGGRNLAGTYYKYCYGGSDTNDQYTDIIDPDSQYCPDRQICKPHHDLLLEWIETACMFIFTAEYMVLVFTVPFAPSRLAHTLDHHEWDEEHHFHKPDPVYPVWWQMWKFFSSIKMLIDLVTLLPFYITINSNPVLGDPAADAGFSSNFIRVFRLLRVLHIFKVTKKNVVLNLVERTMKLSFPTIVLTGFVCSIHMIFWGSLIHYFEQVEFRSGPTLETWMENPDGTWMRPKHTLFSQKSDMKNTRYWEPSPFTSIAIGIYWAMLMTTTTGVGDQLQPTTDGGRFCAVFVSCIGVILMAIPVGVVGLNFAQEWEKMKVQLLEESLVGPSKRIKMSESTVIAVSDPDAENGGGGEHAEKELSARDKIALDISEANHKIAHSMEKITMGQKELNLAHEQIVSLMMKLSDQMALTDPTHHH